MSQAAIQVLVEVLAEVSVELSIEQGLGQTWRRLFHHRRKRVAHSQLSQRTRGSSHATKISSLGKSRGGAPTPKFTHASAICCDQGPTLATQRGKIGTSRRQLHKRCDFSHDDVRADKRSRRRVVCERTKRQRARTVRCSMRLTDSVRTMRST